MNFIDKNPMKFAFDFSQNRFYFAALWAQMKLETGNFQSNLYVNYSNAFGMRKANKRKQNYLSTVDTENGQFVSYVNDIQSYLDRIDLDRYNNVSVPNSIDEVYNYMKTVTSKGYAVESDYLDVWKKVFDSLISDLEVQEFLNGTNDELFKSFTVNYGSEYEYKDGNSGQVIYSWSFSRITFYVVLVVLVLFGLNLLKKKVLQRLKERSVKENPREKERNTNVENPL